MADTFFFLYNKGRTKRKGVDDYGIIGSQTSGKKHIQTGLEQTRWRR